MRKYQILEHRADLKIKVFGKTKEELFENAMVGMLKAGGYKMESTLKSQKIKIKIKSLDLISLLVDFLSEIIYLTETKKLVFEKVKFEKLTDTELVAVLFGKKLKKIQVNIKGVTFYNSKISQKENGKWEAVLLFDI